MNHEPQTVVDDPSVPARSTSHAAVQAAHRRVAEAALHGARATVTGIVANTILAAVKILAGVLGNAYALIADGVESMLDIVSSIIVWGSLRAAARGPNERFPFGYGRVEPLAALVVALALLTAAVGIAVQSAREILTPHHAPAPFTLLVLVAVVATKEIMYLRLSRKAREIGSTAIESDAWHHRSDSLTSLAAFVGISIALAGGRGYETADDWAALVACGVIAFNGWRILRAALDDILDAAPDPALEQQMRDVAARVPGVAGLHYSRMRKSGLGYFVDLQVIVDKHATVEEGHRVGHAVKDALLAADLALLDVDIHIEPTK